MSGLFQVDNLLLLFVSSSDHQSTYTSASVLQTATVLVAVTSRKSFCLSLQKWMLAMPLTSTMRHIVRGLVFYNFRLPEDDFKRKLGQEPCIVLDINIVTQVTADGFDWLSLSMTTSHWWELVCNWGEKWFFHRLLCRAAKRWKVRQFCREVSHADCQKPSGEFDEKSTCSNQFQLPAWLNTGKTSNSI